MKILYLFKKDKSKLKSMHIQNCSRKPTVLGFCGVGWVFFPWFLVLVYLFIYLLAGGGEGGVVCEYLQTSP